MINPYLNVPSLSKPAVRVTAKGDALKYTISWDAQPAATGYRVYAGFDPLNIRSLISGVTPITATSFDFELSDLPPKQVVYFWVGSMEPSGMRFLDELGSYHLRTVSYDSFAISPFSETSQALLAGEDQLYYVEEMRRRAKAILEDTGEEVDLYIKQWTGLSDPTTQDELGLDPNYQPMTRNDETYGVGFYPGYFPAIRLRMRFGGLPQSQMDYQVPGLRPLTDNMAWTLWDPIMHEHDLIVRVNTGLRYEVSEMAFSNYRSVPLTQRLTLSVVGPNSPLQKVNDADVRAKWGKVDAVAYAKVGFNVLPPADSQAANYMIF